MGQQRRLRTERQEDVPTPRSTEHDKGGHKPFLEKIFEVIGNESRPSWRMGWA